MTSELPARIVTAVLAQLGQHPDVFEWLVLLEDDVRQALEAELEDVVRREIREDAVATLKALAAEQARKG